MILQYQWILFDLDGTLTDSAPGIMRSAQYALHHFGVEENDTENLRRLIGPPLTAAFRDYYRFPEEIARKVTEKYRERYRSIGLYENRVYDGIPALLEALTKQGKTLAVATGKPTVFTNRILEHFHLDPYFSAVLGTELDGRRSDKAEVIAELLEGFHAADQKDRVLMIGDRLNDISAARRSGIDSVGVGYGFADPGELEPATYYCETVAELQRFLLQH